MQVAVHRYRDSTGSEPFTEWLGALRDHQARARILVRIERLAIGNFGDTRLLRKGVWELRVDYGPGYRVYFAREGNAVVMLLCGGDKRRQDVDIEKAIAIWKEHESRRG